MLTNTIGSILLLLNLSLTGQQQSAGALIEEPEESAIDIEIDAEGAPDSSISDEDSLPAIDKMPQQISFIKAEYPDDLVKKGVEGTVILELLVNENGDVDSVSVVRGLEPRLDKSAASASKQFKFTPAVAEGEPVAVLLQYEYRFSLDDAVDSIPQAVNFSGQVLEKGTRTPIADAMIVLTFKDTIDNTLPLPFSKYIGEIGKINGQRLEENKLVTESDSDGAFHFYALPACSVEVMIVANGYSTYQTLEKITPGEELVVRYFTERHTYSDLEIVVYGKIEEKEVSRHQMSIQEVRKIPGLAGDAIRVVQAMPGVARPSLGSGQVIVRGSPSWDSRYFLDGVQLHSLYHFGGMKSVYNSEALESIDFYPGGYGTRYGGAIAGVIEINGRKAKSDRIHGQVDVCDIDGSFFIEGPINKNISVLASGRRSFIGDIISWATKKAGDLFPAVVSPFYWDYLLRTDATISKDHNLFFTLFGYRDSMGIVYPEMRIGSEELSDAADRLGMNLSFHMGILGWDWTPATKWKNSLRYSLTYGIQRASIFGMMKQDADMLVSYFRDQLTYKFNRHCALNIGADIENISYDIMLVIPGANGLFQRDTTENWSLGVVGAYLNLELKPLESLLIVPGVRYDYFPELIYDGSIVPEFWNYRRIDNNKGYSGEPSLRLNSRYEIVKKHTLKAAIGNYSQTPQPMGQVIHEKWGEPSLPSTKAAHYVAGYEWQINDLISSDIQFYYNNQWNIPAYAEGNDLSETKQLWFSNGRGRMYGMELMLRHQQSEKFFGWVAYTLSRSERYDNKEKNWILYGKDQTHNLQVLGSWHLKREFDFGFRMRFVSGDPTTPVTGIIESENGNYILPEYGKTNSSRVNPFFQLDLRLDKKLVFDKWIYSFYVDLQNISWFLYKSPEMEIYSYDYSDKTTFSMFPMLAVGVKAEF
ncbi:MAG: TonB-dependent receptor [Fibrobacter sp.]|nr:TonB-dependent receptor [Fibrobacter sp.]